MTKTKFKSILWIRWIASSK